MISDAQIKLWSRIGMRGTFGQVLLDYAKADPSIMVLSADLGVTSGLTRYMDELPEQFLNVGIAEQNMIGIATGMAIKGYRVFTTSFAPFATARCCEQIKVNMGEMKIPVIVVGIASGFEMEYFGNSHYGFDDIAFMRAISGLTILSPADTTELVKMIEKLQTYCKPVYLRLTKMSRKSLIYKEDFDYEIGKANWLKGVGDITIISTGSISATAVLVAGALEEAYGISCGVLDMHTLKPIDTESIAVAFTRSKLVVTLEEHSVIGGLGSAVAETGAGISDKALLMMLGVNDEHTHVGDYDYLIKEYGLDQKTVYDRISMKWEEVAFQNVPD